MSRSSKLARWAAALILAALGMLGGCAGTPRTTVVLMPDEDGRVGAVVVSSADTAQRIDQAYSAVTVVGTRSPPSVATARGQKAVESSYADLLKAQPLKPRTYILHFLLDSTAMTEESKALVPEVVEAVRARKPTEITIYGHTDATGTERHNDRLSAERARVVADLLRKSDPTLDHIDVRSCGDRAPLVPSDARTPQPRNRRAEVVIL
jgi:outer membrane protein OmpA-like peptidoglycan-associated protein